MPACWIIAGPNGAGKTTFALRYLPQVAHCHNFINADLIAAGLSPRVAERVAHGGHDIPAADIDRRFARSLRHLLQDFSDRVDFCQCFMNSGPVPELVFEQTGTQRVVIYDAHYQRLLMQAQT